MCVSVISVIESTKSPSHSIIKLSWCLITIESCMYVCAGVRGIRPEDLYFMTPLSNSNEILLKQNISAFIQQYVWSFCSKYQLHFLQCHLEVFQSFLLLFSSGEPGFSLQDDSLALF